jgi:hypothetical protein
MKTVLDVTVAVIVGFAVSGRGEQPKEPAHGAKADAPEAAGGRQDGSRDLTSPYLSR